jgi:hypothetical protein
MPFTKGKSTMKKYHFLYGAAAVALLLAVVIGMSVRPSAHAQGPGPRGELFPQAATSTSLSASLGTGFTYQGYLEDGGSPVNGSYDLQFNLYDAARDSAVWKRWSPS